MHPETGQLKQLPTILIISSLGSPPYLGGIENVIDTLLKSELRKSYRFTVFDTYRKPDRHRSIYSKIIFALQLPFRCGYCCLHSKPMVAHIHFCSRTDFWKHALCLIACKLTGTKTIFHLHGGSFDTIYQRYNKVQKFMVRVVLQQADILVVLSRYWKEFLAGLVNKDTIHIIPNPINCDKLAKYSKQTTDHIPHTIVLLGSLGKRKGHYDVLQAAPLVIKRYPDTRFYFAGLDEDFDATKQLQQLAQDNNLQNNIRFPGPVTGEAKLKLLGEAGIIILPSYGENMPISVLEGMAAWKPVITTTVGAIPEVISHGENGLLIAPGDRQDLARQILYLFDNPDTAFQIGRKAGQKVRDRWDVKIISYNFYDIYHSVFS